MKNLAIRREGNELIIRIDLTQEHGPSKSGKTTLVATTSGNEAVANVNGKPVYLGLNLYRYAAPEED